MVWSNESLPMWIDWKPRECGYQPRSGVEYSLGLAKTDLRLQIVIIFSITIGAVIITEASLSFLGFGSAHSCRLRAVLRAARAAPV